jgi:hypothetical protein
MTGSFSERARTPHARAHKGPLGRSPTGTKGPHAGHAAVLPGDIIRARYVHCCMGTRPPSTVHIIASSTSSNPSSARVKHAQTQLQLAVRRASQRHSRIVSGASRLPFSRSFS